MAEFLAMGGYGSFVWPAYGVTAVVVVGLIVWSARAHRAVKARVALLEAQADRPGS
jgi:heme exporter protein D